MGNTYTIPDFTIYRPSKLNQLVRKLENIEANTESEITEERFQIAVKKLKEDKYLKRRDYKTLLYRIDELQEMNLIEYFMAKAKTFFYEHTRIYYHIKALIYSYYKLYRYKGVFQLLKLGISTNVQWKNEMKLIKKIVEESNSISEFFVKVNDEFSQCDTIQEMESKIEELMMDKDTPLLQVILTNKVLKLIKKESINNNAEYLLYITNNYISSVKYKEIFEKILLTQKDYNLEKISPEIEQWFRYIGEELGDPYGMGKVRWKGICEEAVKVFQQWRVLKQIGVFFTEITGDPRRLNFWKQYSGYFYRVEYFQEYDRALLMETSKHLFIEFAKIGALYMYRKDIMNIEQVENASLNYSKNQIIRDFLKDKYTAELRLVHSGYWEYNFNKEFQYYDYYVEDDGNGY